MHKAICIDCNQEIDCNGKHGGGVDHVCTPCYEQGAAEGRYGELPEIDDDLYPSSLYDDAYERFYDRDAY